LLELKGNLMRTIIAALAASALLAGCISSQESHARPPNYAASQANQLPAFRNDNFGGAAMPMRGLPH
jgi:outer membrane murein-binding lipoprotein Lpp